MNIDDRIENLLLEMFLSQQSDYGESKHLDSILRPQTPRGPRRRNWTLSDR